MTMKVNDPSHKSSHSTQESDSKEHPKLTQNSKKKKVKKKKKEFDKHLALPDKHQQVEINIPQARKFTQFVDRKQSQEQPKEVGQLDRSTTLQKFDSERNPNTLRQTFIHNQATQLQQPGSQYTSTNVEISHALSGSLNWKIVNGPLRGLKISAAITDEVLNISLEPATSEQHKVLNNCRDNLEQVAIRKRQGKPVKLEVKNG